VGEQSEMREGIEQMEGALGRAGTTLDLTCSSTIVAVTQGGHASSKFYSLSATNVKEFDVLNSDETETEFQLNPD
jgi:hypothetical protein